MDWDECDTVARWWFYGKLLDGLWQALVINVPLSLICSGLAAYFRHSPYRQGFEGAVIALAIVTFLNVALIILQRRRPWRKEFPRKPLTHNQLDNLAGRFSALTPREIHLIRNEGDQDCVQLARQLRMLFVEINWQVTAPGVDFYDNVLPGIRVNAMRGDIVALEVRNALADVLDISVGIREPPPAQQFDWVEIEIGRIL
jgi:hypothetical protein